MIFKVENSVIGIYKIKLDFQVPHSKLKLHKKSLFPSFIHLPWNSVADKLKIQTDIDKFKNLPSEFLIKD